MLTRNTTLIGSRRSGPRRDRFPHSQSELAAQLGKRRSCRSQRTQVVQQTAVEMILKYRNPRSIAESLAAFLHEGLVSEDEVDQVFQGLRNDQCSEGAARTMSLAFLADYSRLRHATAAEKETYALWQRFLNETEHYVRRVTGGRRPLETTHTTA
jgi:hypothetical protein